MDIEYRLATPNVGDCEQGYMNKNSRILAEHLTSTQCYMN